MALNSADRRLLSETRSGRLALPAIGGGHTAERWLRLVDLARMHDVGVARLVEAHLDALAILSEAGLDPNEGLYGVWASRGDAVVDAGTIHGTKPFCSGVGICDRALVTARDDGGRAVLVDVDARRVTPTGPSWPGPALRTTATSDVRFDAVNVDRTVGAPGWYLDRPGFWHGAIGPAACWAGGALGVADGAAAFGGGDDPHALVARGAAHAAGWALQAALRRAGDETDAAPDDVVAGRIAARTVRHLVAHSCRSIIETLEAAAGPRLHGDPALDQRIADVRFYVLQEHGDRDLAALGSDLSCHRRTDG